MADVEKVSKFLKDAGVFYLATVDGDQPKTRPLGFQTVVDDKIYLSIGDFKEVYKQLQANPKCEIVTFIESEILRIYGEAEFDDNEQVIGIFKEALPELAQLYESNGWNIKPFYLKNATVEFRDMFAVKESFEM